MMNAENFSKGDQAASGSDASQEMLEIETKRSLVRQMVTYAVIFVYLLLAGIVICWLMWAGRHDVAIGVLGGVAGLAGSITGFWFGSRKPREARSPEQDSD